LNFKSVCHLHSYQMGLWIFRPGCLERQSTVQRQLLSVCEVLGLVLIYRGVHMLRSSTPNRNNGLYLIVRIPILFGNSADSKSTQHQPGGTRLSILEVDRIQTTISNVPPSDRARDDWSEFGLVWYTKTSFDERPIWVILLYGHRKCPCAHPARTAYGPPSICQRKSKFAPHGNMKCLKTRVRYEKRFHFQDTSLFVD
jgi:hypothetical protein